MRFVVVDATGTVERTVNGTGALIAEAVAEAGRAVRVCVSSSSGGSGGSGSGNSGSNSSNSNNTSRSTNSSTSPTVVRYGKKENNCVLTLKSLSRFA